MSRVGKYLHFSVDVDQSVDVRIKLSGFIDRLDRDEQVSLLHELSKELGVDAGMLFVDNQNDQMKVEAFARVFQKYSLEEIEKRLA